MANPNRATATQQAAARHAGRSAEPLEVTDFERAARCERFLCLTGGTSRSRGGMMTLSPKRLPVRHSLWLHSGGLPWG